MTTTATQVTGRARPSIKLRDDHQRDELRRVAGEMTARTGQRVTLADVIERLLDSWRAAGTTRTEAGR